MSANREPGFERRGDAFLAALNQALRDGEDKTTATMDTRSRFPVVFVVGPPRSGTTLLIQWLARTGQFAVPSNLMARMPEAPYLAGMLQRLLTDPTVNYRGELDAVNDQMDSVAGKTRGVLGAHEFFYFWRRFFPLDIARPLTADERGAVDQAGFARGIGLLQQALNLPLAMKAIIAQYDLDLVMQALPTSILAVTSRDEVSNVESLLWARRTVLGSEQTWFSARPPGSESFDEDSPVTQVAAQVALTNDHLEDQLRKFDPSRVVRVAHHEFCASPSTTYAALARACAQLGHQLGPYVGPASFVEHRRPSERADAIAKELDRVRGHRTIDDAPAPPG